MSSYLNRFQQPQIQRVQSEQQFYQQNLQNEGFKQNNLQQTQVVDQQPNVQQQLLRRQDSQSVIPQQQVVQNPQNGIPVYQPQYQIQGPQIQQIANQQQYQQQYEQIPPQYLQSSQQQFIPRQFQQSEQYYNQQSQPPRNTFYDGPFIPQQQIPQQFVQAPQQFNYPQENFIQPRFVQPPQELQNIRLNRSPEPNNSYQREDQNDQNKFENIKKKEFFKQQLPVIEDGLNDIRNQYLYKKARPQNTVDQLEFERDERLRSYNEKYGPYHRFFDDYQRDTYDSQAQRYNSFNVQRQSPQLLQQSFQGEQNYEQGFEPRGQFISQSPNSRKGRWVFVNEGEDPTLQNQFQQPLYDRFYKRDWSPIQPPFQPIPQQRRYSPVGVRELPLKYPPVYLHDRLYEREINRSPQYVENFVPQFIQSQPPQLIQNIRPLPPQNIYQVPIQNQPNLIINQPYLNENSFNQGQPYPQKNQLLNSQQEAQIVQQSQKIAQEKTQQGLQQNEQNLNKIQQFPYQYKNF